MKKFLLILVALLAVQLTQAQYYYVPNLGAGKNPGGLNTDVEYPVGGGISAGWAVVLSGAPASPGWSTNQTLPFNFDFNGTSVNTYKVSNSGVLTFTTIATTVPAYGTVALPDANIPDKSVCIMGLKPFGNNSTYANIVSKTFGTAPNRQYWVSFSAYNETNLGATGFNFWSIVLEETTNKIYVVDQRSYGAAACKLSVGVQINSTTATSVLTSPSLPATAGTDPTPADNSYYEFIKGTQPTYDLSVTKGTMPEYLILSQAPFSVTAEFFSIGTAKVSSADLNYSVNGGAVVTGAGTGVAINVFSKQTLAHPTKWTPSTIGVYTIKVWASNINGNADQNKSNDTGTIVVNVVDNFTPRVILDEVFTSSTCPPCNPGNANFLAVTTAKDPKYFTVVKYQMNYPGTGDPYYTAECGTRHSFYGINSIPRMEVDGGWDGNANSYTSALHDGFQAKPAFMEVSGTSSVKWKTVSITANIKPLTDITSTSLRLFAAVNEKQTVKNVKTNGETDFLHVMKKMVPDANGTLLTGLTKNTTKTVNLSWTAPGVYTLAPSGASPINIATQNSIEEFSDLEVVLWVQDVSTKEVWQSGYTTHTYLGLDQQNNNVQSIGIHPNPTNGVTKVSFMLNNEQNINVQVVDALGKVVKSFPSQSFYSGVNGFDFDATGMAHGVYFMKFNGENFSVTQKFVVD